MKISPWLSVTFERLSRRERLVVVSGAIVSVVALAAVYVVQPAVSAWLDREAGIAVKAEQLARIEALLGQEATLRDALTELREERASAARRLLEGNTAAVAASGLQLLLNRYAEESRVLLQRVDVAGTADADSGDLVTIPARLSGSADIYGLVDLVFYLQQGEKLLVIDDFRASGARSLPSDRGLLTWAIDLHGYYAPPGDRP